jgi:phosphoglycolate phosphatase
VTGAPQLAAPLRGVRALLLDFDGPVTVLMPPPLNAKVAAAARAPLASSGMSLPSEIETTTDHLAVLRWVGQHERSALAAVEGAVVLAEEAAASTSTLTTGADDLLTACELAGVPVVIVTNNAASAADLFLRRHGLRDQVLAIMGRPAEHPELMKPATHLVDVALDLVAVDAGSTALVGDSVSDVTVSHAAGVLAVGYAKHVRRGAELREVGADVIVTSIADLTASS